MNIEAVTTLAAALSDATRLRLFSAVVGPEASGREVCVCELTELVDLAPSTVSKHLSILRDAGLIEGRKQGRWMYYRVADAEGMIEDAIRWIRGAQRQDGVLQADLARLGSIIADAEVRACCTTGENDVSSSCAPETLAAARWPKDGQGT